MDTALYFPYIRVPRTAWFTQILLYWDQAAVILPSSLWDQRGTYDPYMHELTAAGLLRPMSPDDAWKVDQEQFDDGFLRLLDERVNGDGGPNGQVVANGLGGPEGRSPERRSTRIHTGKMSHHLFRTLVDRGLAEPDEGPGWETWWHVETSTADLFMGYLAAVMSGAHPGTVPVTDSMSNVSKLAGALGSEKQRLEYLRYRVISNALPVPRHAIAPAKIAGFKEENREQLRRCRTYLDGKLVDLAAMDRDELSDTRLSAITLPIEDDVAKLMEQMKKRRWPGVAMLGWSGVAAASLGTAATMSGAETPLALGLGVGAGVLTAGKGVYESLTLMREPTFDVRAPLAYAALAGRL